METMAISTLTPRSTARLRRWLEASVRFVRQRPLGGVGAVIIAIMILAAVLADVIAPFDPLTTNYAAMLQAPSSLHWFGTDSFGRDVFTRIVYGSRTALWIGFVFFLLGATVVGLIGVSAAHFSRRIRPLL